MKKWIVSIFLVFMVSFAMADKGQNTPMYDGIYIGGGHPMGLRFATAGTLCMLVDDVDCVVSASGDSLQSLEGLMSGRLDMAVVQSDWLQHAVHGTSRFSSIGANPDLRVLGVLGVETVLVAVRKSKKINSISDLKGKSFAIGVDKTYRGLFGKAVLKSAGLSEKSVNVSQMSTDASAEALCSDAVDASIFVASTPNMVVDRLSAQCDIAFLPMQTNTINQIKKTFKGVFEVVLPADTYWNQKANIPSVGLYTVLVGTSGLETHKATAIQKVLDTKLQALQKMHPTFSKFSPEFIKSGVNVPYYTK